MTSDQIVTPKLILDVLLELQRQGTERAMEELEKVEPELASYLMEHSSLIHQKLLELGAPAKATGRLQRRIESLLLVCISALRKGHHQLWQQTAGEHMAGLDPADADDELPPPRPRPEEEA